MPTGGKAGREFKLFFYPMPVTTREKPWIGAPLGEATFEAGGAVTACRRQEGEPRALSSRRWPEAVSGLGVEEFEKRRARLYALTGTVAARYAAKAAPGPEAREYARLFQELSEPDLGPYYKALNADFWAWLVR